MTNRLAQLKVKLFADGANIPEFVELSQNPAIKGFTTNPTLMRKAGVVDYEAFATELVGKLPHYPISFEVFADDFDGMEMQARLIASWGANVYVKIPVTNTKGEFMGRLISHLAALGVKLNVTALMAAGQVRAVADALDADVPAVVSVFAGRIADTGVDPVPVMAESAKILACLPKAELLWASPREVLNVFQADAAGCHIITATSDILKKLPLLGKNLTEYSLETVHMFHRDATDAGYSIGAGVRVAAE